MSSLQFFKIDDILHYSGLMSIVVVWGVIVIYPTFKLPIKLKHETISQAMALNTNVLKVVCKGLIVGGIFQGLFLLYLYNRFNIPITHPLSYLFISLSLATILAGVFNPVKFPNTHLAVSAYYLFFSPIVMLATGYFLYNSEKIVALVSLICGSLYVIGGFILMIRYRNIQAASLEIYSFFILSLWAVIFTFI